MSIVGRIIWLYSFYRPIAILSGLVIEFLCNIHFKYSEILQGNDLTRSFKSGK